MRRSYRHVWLIALLIAVLATVSVPPTLAQEPPPILTAYILPNEQVYTLRPALRYRDRVYQIHYATTGKLNSTNANIIGHASEFFTQQISGLFITADDKLVEDQMVIREIFSLYRAAYHLEQSQVGSSAEMIDTYPFEDFRKDLRKITGNPFFALQIIGGAFETGSHKNEEAIRAMLTAHRPPPNDIDVFSNNLRRELTQDQNFADAVDRALGAMKFANTKDVRIIAADVRKAFASWRKLDKKLTVPVEIAGKPVAFANALDLARLAVNLMWIADLQKERVKLLQNYTKAFSSGPAALDANAQQAMSTVAAEAESNWQQRLNIVEDFVRDQTIDLTKRVALEKLSEAWVKWAWQKYGTRIAGHNMAGAASLVLLTVSAAQLLYGYNDLYSNFVVAETADDLRLHFRAGRDQLQKQLKASSADEYRGDLAEQYRMVYMLENLAAAQSIRSYADGVEATTNKGPVSILSPINWINWIFGRDWLAAAKEIRQQALGIEQYADDEVGHPAFIEPATTLVLERLTIVQPLLGSCPVESSQGVSLNEEHNRDTGAVYALCVDLRNPYLRIQTVMANDIRSVNPSPDRRETVEAMVGRLPHSLHHPIVAINADYFGAGHGPEGFTVVEGVRIDGPHSQDTDSNATNRVSLSFSRTNQVSLGFRSAAEVADPLLSLSRFFNTTGGGPTLVRDRTWVRDPCPLETFSRDDVCQRVQQTAIGISPDGRTLVIVAAEQRDADEMGRLLIDHGVSNGMKLDGGGSTQLWYSGTNLLQSNRGVANAIVIFREEIPRHDAFLMKQDPFPVVEPGAPIQLSMILRNVGFLPWDPRLTYGLKLSHGESFGLADWQPLPKLIQTNSDVQWTFPSQAPIEPGLYQTEWQLVYRDAAGHEEPIGLPVGFVVTVLPKGTSPDIASMWQQLVDQAQAEAKGRLEAFWESLQQEIYRRMREELRKIIPPELWCFFGLGVMLSNITLIGRRIHRKRNNRNA